MLYPDHVQALSMPPSITFEREKLNQAMYQKLKKFIMSKRRLEQLEKAQNAQAKRLKREKEERKRQTEKDRETLESVRREVSQAKKKFDSLKSQRDELYHHLKQLASEANSLKEKHKNETVEILSSMQPAQFGPTSHQQQPQVPVVGSGSQPNRSSTLSAGQRLGVGVNQVKGRNGSHHYHQMPSPVNVLQQQPASGAYFINAPPLPHSSSSSLMGQFHHQMTKQPSDSPPSKNRSHSTSAAVLQQQQQQQQQQPQQQSPQLGRQQPSGGQTDPSLSAVAAAYFNALTSASPNLAAGPGSDALQQLIVAGMAAASPNSVSKQAVELVAASLAGSASNNNNQLAKLMAFWSSSGQGGQSPANTGQKVGPNQMLNSLVNVGGQLLSSSSMTTPAGLPGSSTVTSTTSQHQHPGAFLDVTADSDHHQATGSLLPPATISYRGSITTGQSAQQIQLQQQQQQAYHKQPGRPPQLSPHQSGGRGSRVNTPSRGAPSPSVRVSSTTDMSNASLPPPSSLSAAGLINPNDHLSAAYVVSLAAAMQQQQRLNANQSTPNRSKRFYPGPSQQQR